uniref:Uncharacterized protein n=1 Tax=Nelumbo nucifera TaxID=4432 RepID=A0A822ZRN1_NELNU|nr:TPA_asm: hypothetical protein HUJ06_004315 [Nelumbo nucifera]
MLDTYPILEFRHSIQRWLISDETHAYVPSFGTSFSLSFLF